MAQATVERRSDAGKRDEWYAQDPAVVLAAFGTNPQTGLTAAQAQEHLAKFGPNTLKQETPPSFVTMALGQLRDPMNIMLIAVTVVSFLINERSTALLVAMLVAINVLLGAKQEMKARASVEALAKMQIPAAK